MPKIAFDTQSREINNGELFERSVGYRWQLPLIARMIDRLPASQAQSGLAVTANSQYWPVSLGGDRVDEHRPLNLNIMD